MIKLSPLSPEETTEIKAWPPYPAAFAALDYAIRDGGWLDTRKPGADFLAVYAEKTLIGFVGLNEADFLIALHPEHLGMGYGTLAEKMALEHYFRKYDMDRISAVVRKSNHASLRVCEKNGFVVDGETVLTIQDQPVEFWRVHIDNFARNA